MKNLLQQIESIREIVINMKVQREYWNSRASVIKIFDNRIEFFNPGKLFDHQTVEQSNVHLYKSNKRKKLIALMFKDYHLVETYGPVITRLKKLCMTHAIRAPKFEESYKAFKVILYKVTTQERKTSTKQKICKQISGNKQITRIGLAKRSGVSENAIKQQLARLKRVDIIQRVRSTKSGHVKMTQ